MKKVKLLSALTAILFFLITFYIHTNKPHQTAIKAHASNIKTYDYVITGKDDQGYYGKSLSNDTKIFLVQSNLPKDMTLNVHDSIRVSFPNDQFDQITSVQKLK